MTYTKNTLIFLMVFQMSHPIPPQPAQQPAQPWLNTLFTLETSAIHTNPTIEIHRADGRGGTQRRKSGLELLFCLFLGNVGGGGLALSVSVKN